MYGWVSNRLRALLLQSIAESLFMLYTKVGFAAQGRNIKAQEHATKFLGEAIPEGKRSPVGFSKEKE